MDGYDAGSYGDAMADVYDQWSAIPGTDEAASTLATLAGGRGASVLELGVGTGRLALPLARSGCRVVGLDASPRMLDHLREQPDAGLLETVHQDMCSFDFPGRSFDLIFAARDTFLQLVTRDAQQQCLLRASKHLTVDGHFVLEATTALDAPLHKRIEVWRLDADRVVLGVTKPNDGAGTIDGQAIEITERGIRLRPWRLRHVTPEELDLFASESGLVLKERWGGWDRSHFDATCEQHVSVYQVSKSEITSDSDRKPGHTV